MGETHTRAGRGTLTIGCLLYVLSGPFVLFLYTFAEAFYNGPRAQGPTSGFKSGSISCGSCAGLLLGERWRGRCWLPSLREYSSASSDFGVNLGPSRSSAPVSSTRAAPRGLSEPCPARWAHTTAPLGTLQSARSEVERRMWRDRAWRGRAGQAFELGELGVGDGATANSLAADRRGPLQDDQAVKTKLLKESCLRILDQGLGPTRARSSRNRPLEPLCTMARQAQGWAGLPCHTRRM